LTQQFTTLDGKADAFQFTSELDSLAGFVVVSFAEANADYSGLHTSTRRTEASIDARR
jgi:hypothetical protein